MVGAAGVCWAPPAPGSDPGNEWNKGWDLWCHWPDPTVSTDLWEYYLPYLYSCISLFGVLLLLCKLCPHEALVVLLVGSGGAMVGSLAEASRIFLGVWGGVGWQGTSFSVSPPTTVCTPFGLSIMFSVTGKLLVKPRVRCAPQSLCPSFGGDWSPTSGMGSHSHTPAATHRLLTHPQLLEDLDEQLSCTRFEEAAVSHRIRSGGCCWLGKGSMGWTGSSSTQPHRSPHPP